MKNVMKRAWEIARTAVINFGGKVKEYFAMALRMAWEELKTVANTNTKSGCIEKLNTILNASKNGMYELAMQINDWANYGKDRTYFALVETSANSKHYAKKDYGYFDNISNLYVAGKADLNNNFTFSGANF